MNIEDIETIRQILSNYGIDDMLSASEFDALSSELENRENAMVVDLGPRFIYGKGLDRIIEQY